VVFPKNSARRFDSVKSLNGMSGNRIERNRL
jgi:hypothetical protein